MPHYQRLTMLTVVATLVLIGVGATVRITGSGLGCPDWPLCHGGVLPPSEQAPVIEWSHRAVAGLAGALIAAQALWTLLRFTDDRPLALAAILTLPLLLAQALLGREAVVRELPPEVVAAHMVSAQVLLALLAFTAVRAWQHRRLHHRGEDVDPRLRRCAVLVATIAGLAVVAGAYTLADGASLACRTWPACSQAPLPFLDGDGLQHVHWMHRLLAAAGVLSAAWLHWSARGTGRAAFVRGTRALVALYLFQVFLGAMNVWSDLGQAARIGHVVFASLVWVMAVVLASACFGRSDRAPEASARHPELSRSLGALGLPRARS